MIGVFADTSYWLAILNERDAYHSKAQAIGRPPRIVTTLPVLIEVMDALSAPQHRAPALHFWQATNNDSTVLIVPLVDSMVDEAVSLFGNRPDKHWSLTDCFSFVVMRDRQITQALTTDHHFEQAGFQALLRDGS